MYYRKPIWYKCIIELLHQQRTMLRLFKLVWIFFTHVKLTKQYDTQLSRLDSIQHYCTSFSSCQGCKGADLHCEWCHEIGCTHYPSLHCPQKLFLDNVWHKNSEERYCTEIVSSDPIFVPANIRRFIKLNLKIDDLTLYKRHIMCEIHIEQTVLRVKGSMGESTLYCDMTILRIMRNVALGYVRLLWGGAEPFSNMILMVVYRCELMASNCMECQALDKRFNCGWCEETSQCILLEECPRQAGPWIDKKSLCSKYYRDVSYLNKKDMRRIIRYSTWKSHYKNP